MSPPAALKLVSAPIADLKPKSLILSGSGIIPLGFVAEGDGTVVVKWTSPLDPDNPNETLAVKSGRQYTCQIDKIISSDVDLLFFFGDSSAASVHLGGGSSSGGGGGGDATAANQTLALTALDAIYDALALVGLEATNIQIRDAVTNLGDGATLADLAAAFGADADVQADILAALQASEIDIDAVKSGIDLLVPDLDAVRVATEAMNAKIPASPAQDRTTAAAPSATRASNGTAFIDLALESTLGLVRTAAEAIRDRLPAALVNGRLDTVIGAPLPTGTNTIGNVGSDLRVGGSAVGPVNPIPASNAAASQVDGHSVSIGSTGDADTANTVIGRLKNLLSRIPTALVNNRFDINIGSWFGSVASALSDTMANPSTPLVGAALMGWTGAQWRRLPLVSTGGVLAIGNAGYLPLVVAGQTGGSVTTIFLTDANGRSIVAGPGPSTPATSVSMTEAVAIAPAVGAIASAQFGVLKASAGRLISLRIESASTGTFYLQLHDASTTGAIAAGTIKGLGYTVAGVGDEFVIVFAKPISFATGIAWALSTTKNTYTAAAGKVAFVEGIWE